MRQRQYPTTTRHVRSRAYPGTLDHQSKSRQSIHHSSRRCAPHADVSEVRHRGQPGDDFHVLLRAGHCGKHHRRKRTKTRQSLYGSQHTDCQGLVFGHGVPQHFRSHAMLWRLSVYRRSTRSRSSSGTAVSTPSGKAPTTSNLWI